MKWRIVSALLSVLLPALVEALSDGRLEPHERESLLVALLRVVEVVSKR